jgi:tetratricopeptide (TPR) repeat protein
VEHKKILETYYQNEDFEGLVEYATIHIDTDATNYLLFGARGKAYIELGDFRKAVFDISNALKLNPDYTLGYYNRGIAYSKSCEYELGLQDLEKAKTFAECPDDIDYVFGMTYYCLEKHETAIEYFSEYLENYEDIDALGSRADCYYETNQFEKAQQDITEILLLDIPEIQEIECINNTPNRKIMNLDIDENQSFSDLGFSILYNDHCYGIYILEFTNNEFYIGQTKSMKKRLTQHSKKYDDIATVYFKAVQKENLFDEECRIISIFEQQKIRIRNLIQIEFLNHFDENQQAKWKNDLTFNLVNGNRFYNKSVQNNYASRFLIFQKKVFYNDFISLLSQYFIAAMPNYIASEFNYWNITCLPKHLQKEKCVSRININGVPVLSIYEGEDGELNFMLFLSKLPLLKYLNENDTLPDWFITISSLKFDFLNTFEDKTNGDEGRLSFHQKDFENVLKNPTLLSAIRLFNLRMLNKVGDADRRSTNHCSDLANAIIDNIL